MDDVREFIVLDQLTARRFFSAPKPPGFFGKTKLRVRRLVVATDVGPMRAVYAAIYRLHVWYAVRTLSRIPDTAAIYVTRGAASKHVLHGISDIDLFVMGNWASSGNVIKRVFILSLISPLFDQASTHQIHTVANLRKLYEADYYLQFRFNQGRTRCKLVFGADVLAALPPVAADRVRGGLYTETRMWWMQFGNSAFGDGAVAWDRIFRNSIAHKSVCEMLGLETAMAGGRLPESREQAAEEALPRLDPAQQEVVKRLQESQTKRYLRYRGDAMEDAMRVLLTRIEKIHALLPQGEPFLEAPAKDLTIDVPAAEVYRSAEAVAVAAKIVEQVKRTWGGYRRAFLLPRCGFAGFDDLQLLLEVGPAQLPTAAQVRAVCAIEQANPREQRLAIYLLLPNGAYIVNREAPLEFWHILQAPAANPETFHLLDRAEFTLDGTPRPAARHKWTKFAATLARDELQLRRAVTAQAMAYQGKVKPLITLGGMWRHLQLEVLHRSAAGEAAYFPVTVGAILRGMESVGLTVEPILRELQKAYEDELNGRPSKASELIPRAIPVFAQFK
jgi:hypothetical protein